MTPADPGLLRECPPLGSKEDEDALISKGSLSKREGGTC